MRVGEIKEELESYGISTRSFLEKSELVEALEKARADGLKPKTEEKKEKKKKKRRSGDDDSSPSASATEEPSKPREERLQEELENCRQMKAGELKKELEERGVSTRSFFEKSEFVQALAEARVDGIEKKNEEGYAEYTEVEVLTDDNSGPRNTQAKQQQQQAQARSNPFGGGASPFGGGMPGGMGGMGGIADMLKNMGGGAGGAAGGAANPFAGMGGMGGMGDAMGKAQEMMKNPKVMEIMMKAQVWF